MSLKNHRNDFPEASRRRFFLKTVDLHETLAGIVQTHVRPPPESSMFAPFGPQSRLNALPERCPKNDSKKDTDKSPKVSKMTPNITLKSAKNRHKIAGAVSWYLFTSQSGPRGGYPLKIHRTSTKQGETRQRKNIQQNTHKKAREFSL